MVRTNFFNIEATRGDDANKLIHVLNNGSNYDMSSSTVHFTMKESPTATGSISSITCTAGSTGSIAFTMGSPATQNIGIYSYDIQETTSTSKINTLAIGSVTIIQDVRQ